MQVSRLVLALDLAGTFVFGLSGGLAGTRRRLDIFGVAVIAIVVAMTGGIVRDLLIGVPPRGFRDWRYIAAGALAGVICFAFHHVVDRLETPIRVFDALGLSLFCVTGTTTALADGIAPFQASILGLVTGIGGGVLCDVLLGETPPRVMRQGLYAVPALIGAAVVATAYRFGYDNDVIVIPGAAACFSLWLVGWHFGIELPTPKSRGDRDRPTKPLR